MTSQKTFESFELVGSSGQTAQVEDSADTPKQNEAGKAEKDEHSYLQAQLKSITQAASEMFKAMKHFMSLGPVSVTILLFRMFCVSFDLVMNWKFLEEVLSYNYGSNVAFIATKFLICFTVLSSGLYLLEILSYIADLTHTLSQSIEQRMSAGILVGIIAFQELPLTILVMLIAEYGQNCSFNNTVLYTLVAKLRLASGILILFYRIVASHKLLHKYQGFRGLTAFATFALLTAALRLYLFVLVFIPTSIKLDLVIKYGNRSVTVTDNAGWLATSNHFYSYTPCSNLLTEQQVNSIFNPSIVQNLMVDITKCSIRFHFYLDTKNEWITMNSAMDIVKSRNEYTYLCTNYLNYGDTVLEANAQGCNIPKVIFDHDLSINCF